jgi:PAS domain S-box-containing protein
MDTRLSFLLERSNDFFVVLDRNGTVVHTNAAIRKALGYTEQDTEGFHANYFSHPADKKRREELLKNIGHQKEITGYESRIKSKNGRYYNIRWSFLLNDKDDLIYAIGVDLTRDLNKADRGHLTDNVTHIIQSFNEGFFTIDRKWRVTTFNPAFQAIAGLKSDQLKNAELKKLYTLGMTDEVIAKFEAAFTSGLFTEVQYRNTHFNRWVRLNIYPYKDEITVFIRDITAIRIQQQVLALEKKVLELNASSLYTLEQTTKELLLGIEEIFPDMICSVLEVDEQQERVYHLSAPRLPSAYCDIINGLAIGPQAGSCGTAVYHRSQVIVSDIETDPLWQDYKDLVAPFNLKACWSTPIISSHSAQVLATFAVYYTTKREPTAEELLLVERTTNILRILIENKRHQEHVTDQNQRLQEIATISSHEIRRPVATILGLVNLFDQGDLKNPMNKEIVSHLDSTAKELDAVIHTIVEKSIYLKSDDHY